MVLELIESQLMIWNEDDTVLISVTLQNLQALITAVVEVSENNELSLHINETKFMLVIKSDHKFDNI